MNPIKRLVAQQFSSLLGHDHGHGHDGKWKMIMTVFIAARWKLMLEHGEVDGTSISIVRPPGIVHMLQI